MWTYSGDPNLNARDEVRFLVGDTNAADPLVQDEEIAFVLAVHADPPGKVNYQAAAVVAEGIAAKFARKKDSTVGPLSVQAEQLYTHYVEVAQRLRGLARTDGRAGSVGAPPELIGGGKTFLMGTWI